MTDQATRWNGEQTKASSQTNAIRIDAALTPFAMSRYRLAAERETKQLDAEEEPSAATVRLDIQRASNYVVGVVPFAVSLFFAGMSSKLSAARLRHVTIAVGCVVFVGSAICIASCPVSVAV